MSRNEPDELREAWDEILNNYPDELDEYQREFVSDHLVRAGFKQYADGEDVVRYRDQATVLNALCALSLTARQEAFVFATKEKLDDEAYRRHMTDKDD